MNEISERLKFAIKQSGLSHRELEIKTGIPHSAIQRYAAGTTDRIPIGRLETLAKALGTTAEHLLGWESQGNLLSFDNIFPVRLQRIPLLGEIACVEPILAEEDRESYVLAGTDIQADFCLRCKGDSMIGARIQDGDIVFIRKQDMVQNGEIAAVIIENEATLKRVNYFPQKNMLILKAENPKYEDLIYTDSELDQIRILGKAIAFQSDVK